MKPNVLIQSILTGQTPSYGSVLLGLAVREFGVECIEWDPETLALEFKDSFGVELNSVVKNQLNAMMTMLATDMWEQDPVVFNFVANALGDGASSMARLEVANPCEIAWALVEYSIVDRPEKFDPPEEQVENKLSPEVTAFIGNVLKNNAVRPNGLFSFLKNKYDIDYSGWADDPIVAQVMYKESEKSYSDVEEYVRHNLKQLTEQLSQLQLQVPGEQA